MPLPIRDGNQSLTTLSTILVSNAHIPAHTVVSLGTQAITDIATAVSGVELGPNTLNALENITVTLGQVTITGGLTDAQLRASAVTIGGSVTATISGTPSVTFTQASVTFGTAVVTGSASILNFPATQTVTFSQAPVTFGLISGTVTANPTGTQTIAGSVTLGAGTAQIGSVTASISGTVPISISSVTVGNSVTIGSLPAISGTVTVGGFSSVSIGSGALLAGGLRGGGVEPLGLDLATGYLLVKVDSALPAGTNRIGVVTIGAGTVTIGAGTAQIGSVTASISNSVTIASLPAISGTVTVGGFSGNAVTTGYTFNGNAVSSVPVIVMENSNGSIGTVDVSGGFISVTTGTNRIGVVTIGAGTVTLGASTAQIGSVTASISNSLTISSLPAISGTVTANVFGYNYQEEADMQIPVKWDNSDQKYIPIGPSVDPIPLPISGTVTVGSLPSWGVYDSGNDSLKISINDVGGSAIGTSVPISGTVTANSSNGSLTTRFGSVTTANTAFATSAVTNSSRKYLLIQNITTASNVITVGIGFTPTTTQGIQLFAGAGLTFEGTYIPTGSVNLLSSVTASCYTILEA